MEFQKHKENYVLFIKKRGKWAVPDFWRWVEDCGKMLVFEGQAMFLFNKNHACTKAPLNVLHIKRNDVCFTVISGQAQYLFKVVEK